MSTFSSDPSNDPNTEILKSIASSLKSIHTALESLTGAVEGVAESIEKAHEPEGDLGVHLVSALKDLSSSLHRRAQQERSSQPHQQNQRQQQGRQDRRPQFPDQHQSHTDLNASANLPNEQAEEQNTLSNHTEVAPSEGRPEPSETNPSGSNALKGKGNRRRTRGAGKKNTAPSE